MIKNNDLIANLAYIGAVMSTPSKITPEAIVKWRKERAQLNVGLETIREPSSKIPVNPTCSFKSLAKSSSVDLHDDDRCTKRLPCGASGRMHESDKGHPSDSSSSELTDEVVNMVKNCRRGGGRGRKRMHHASGRRSSRAPP